MQPWQPLWKAGRCRPFHGELRDANRTPGRDNRLLPHILSSRIYNKMQNERAQNLLERWAEPWSALAWLEGEDYPQAFLWKSWEWLLQNHPHDSIGGCSLDAVHAQMETRFAWSSEIAEEITRERFELLARQDRPVGAEGGRGSPDRVQQPALAGGGGHHSRYRPVAFLPRPGCATSAGRRDCAGWRPATRGGSP